MTKYLLRLVVAVAMSASALATNEADAGSVTFNFIGVVTGVADGSLGGHDLTGVFSTGQTLTGHYTFESTTPGTISGGVSATYSNALTDLQFTVGGSYSGSLGGPGDIFVDDNNFGADAYVVEAHNPIAPLVAGAGLYELLLILTDDTESALSSLNLPLTPPDLNLFNNTTFELIFGGNTVAPGTVQGQITSLTMQVVPIPAAAWMGLSMLAAMGIIAAARRQQMRQAD